MGEVELGGAPFGKVETVSMGSSEFIGVLAAIIILLIYVPLARPLAEELLGVVLRATLRGDGPGFYVTDRGADARPGLRRLRAAIDAGPVAEGANGQSQVTVHLNFGERSVEPGIRKQTPEGRDPLAEGVSATLESIRRQIAEGAGKVHPPPPPPRACRPLWPRARARRGRGGASTRRATTRTALTGYPGGPAR